MSWNDLDASPVQTEHLQVVGSGQIRELLLISRLGQYSESRKPEMMWVGLRS